MKEADIIYRTKAALTFAARGGMIESDGWMMTRITPEGLKALAAYEVKKG